MVKCAPGCLCKRHTARRDPTHPQNSPEYRERVAAQMRSEWQRRHSDPALLATVSASMSAAHEERWTDERRQQYAGNVGHLHTQEVWDKAAESRRGKYLGQEARGYSISPAGYVDLHMQQGHPLSRSGGLLGEHREVLYDKIGPGPHPCHWCGKLLDWGGLGGIIADHLDGDRINNDPENLVPSCSPCNTGREIEGGT